MISFRPIGGGHCCANANDLGFATDWCRRWIGLARFAHPEKKLAAVFDIDDTLLTRKHRIEDVCELMDLCIASGVTPFIITARSELGREETLKQLEALSITGFKRMFMHPAHEPLANTRDAGRAKMRSRQKIEHHNYKIILNAGDAIHDHFHPVPKDFVRRMSKNAPYVFMDADGVAHLKLPHVR